MGALGYRGTIAQQNKVKRGKMSKQDMFAAPLTEEIFPNIMLF